MPSSADSLEVQGGNTRQATLTGLKPYTSYVVVVKAFNSGGEGPASATILFETKEGGKAVFVDIRSKSHRANHNGGKTCSLPITFLRENTCSLQLARSGKHVTYCKGGKNETDGKRGKIS